MNTYIVKVPIIDKPKTEVFDYENSYEQIRDGVGGFIERAPVPEIETKENYRIDCFVDEEGLVKRPPRPLNLNLAGWCAMSLFGDAVFVAHDENGDTVGLTQEDAKKIMALFP